MSISPLFGELCLFSVCLPSVAVQDEVRTQENKLSQATHRLLGKPRAAQGPQHSVPVTQSASKNTQPLGSP